MVSRTPITTLVGPLPASLKTPSTPKVKIAVYLEELAIVSLQIEII
jgi:hypothetical protein